MDTSQDSGTTSEEESLDSKLTRMSRNFSSTLAAARLAQVTTEDDLGDFRPRATLPVATHTLNLKFPSSTARQNLYPFEDERFSEEGRCSYDSGSSSPAAFSSPPPERLQMLLEDALSRLSQISAPHQLLLTEKDITDLKFCLDSLSENEETTLILGNFQFVIKVVRTSEEIALKYTDILEATEEDFAEELDNREEMIVAAENSGGEIDWQVRMEEYQSAWDLMLEQRRDVEMREAFLSTREEALKSQYMSLEKTVQELETAKQVQEAKTAKWTEDMLAMKLEMESLLQRLLSENFQIREAIHEPQHLQRRSALEKEIIPMREDAMRLIADGCMDADLPTYLDQAEEELIDAVRTGKTAKYKIRLSALRAKLASAKTHLEILKHKDKTASLSMTLDAIGTESSCKRAKTHVQKRIMSEFCAASMRAPSPRFYRDSPSPQQLSPSPSVASEDWLVARSMSTLAGRLSSMSRESQELQQSLRISPSPDCEERNSVRRTAACDSNVKQFIEIHENRVDKWRQIAFQFLSQVAACEGRGKDITQMEMRLRAWEKRLTLIEKELKGRESALRERELAMSKTEDSLLLLAGKHLTAADAHSLLVSSSSELVRRQCELKVEKGDLQASRVAMEAEKLALQERVRLADAQAREVKATQVRLAKASAMTDSLLRSLHHFLSRLRQ